MARLMVIAVLGVLVLTASVIVSVSYVRAARARSAPSRDLAHAARLLDRILTYDEAVPSLPTKLRDEARAFTQRFYKEIEE